MKILLLSFFITFASYKAFAQVNAAVGPVRPDSVTLLVDGLNGNMAYYQKVVKTDSGITVPVIYLRAVEFMASKNFSQTYGYEEEGKLIYTTSQDLNISQVYVGDDNEFPEQYTVQFSITLDLKNSRYRYTVHNVVFFVPDQNQNKRETLYDVYLKATNTDSRRVAREAKKLIDSFERYLGTLTGELYQGIEQHSYIYKKF